ncbi:unnamed protein product, partial [Staurois parvus]
TLPTDTNDGALFHPLTPVRGTIPPTDTNDGALFLPLIPMCPIISVSGRNSAPSLVSGRNMEGIVPHHQWEE